MGLGAKLFIGGIAWATTEVGLRQAFERFGRVMQTTIVMDRETGQSKGFGFVEFENEGSARRAQEAMNGAVLDGRNLRVEIAVDKPKSWERSPRSDDVRSESGGERPPRRR